MWLRQLRASQPAAALLAAVAETLPAHVREWPFAARAGQDASGRLHAQIAYQLEASNASRRFTGAEAGPETAAAPARRAADIAGATGTPGRRRSRLDLARIPMLDTRQSCHEPPPAESAPTHWQDALAQAQRSRPALLDAHGYVSWPCLCIRRRLLARTHAQVRVGA